MRDLLSKIDNIIAETELKSPEDLQAKRKALQDLQMDPIASKDPEIRQAIIQRKNDLEREAKAKGFGESAFQIGDDFGISFNEDLEIATEIVGFTEDGIVIDLDDTALEHLSRNGIHFLEGFLEEGLKDPKDNPCWKGYHPVGTKKKGGKTVPNCVPEAANPAQQAAIAINMKKHHKTPKHEGSDAEYDDEAGMADNNLETMKRAVQGLDDLIHAGDNLPEWCQEKIAVAKSMLVAVWDYMQSEEQTEGIENEAEYHGKNVPLGKKLPGDVKKSKVYVRKPNGNIVKVNFGDKKMRIKKSNPKRRKSFRARHNCKNPGPRWKARYWSCRSW